MKNKSLILLISIILVLGVYSIYLYYNDAPASKLKPNSDFIIENTDDVDKIIIDDNGLAITLTKVNEEWFANDSVKARPEGVELILKTFRRIKVQSSVPKPMVRNVITNLAASSKKVEVFKGGSKPIKTYFIGNPTQDHSGTYMLLETPENGRSSEPYVTHIPGFNGFLSSRFFASLEDWKFTGIFNYNLTNISKIKVDIKDIPSESYQILQAKDGRFSLLNINGEIINNYNKALLQNYLVNYKKIHYNKVMEYTKNQIDSVKLLTPDYIISVTDKNEATKEVLFYKKAANTGEMDPVTRKQQEFDVNYALGIVNDANKVARYQYHVIDPLLMKKSYFLTR
jgi:hypothetical protein